MQRLGLDLAVLTRGESVQWLTGAYVGSLMTPAAAIDGAGRVTLVLPDRKIGIAAAAEEKVPYEAKKLSTFRDDQRAACNTALLAAIGNVSKLRTAGEWSCLGPQLISALGGNPIDIEPLIFALRRCKEADEIRMLDRANQANAAMYARAREIVRPGLNELDLFNELQATAVRTLGEPLTYFGQDFQSASHGGPPRNRQMQAGELIILDLGVGFRGYYSDNARTLVVGDEPTAVQQLAWQAAAEVFDMIAAEARSGVSCRGLFEKAKAMLDRRLPWSFHHHLGHGVGLAPHEGPHLNPNWDDTLAVGDFFAVEPGLYHEDLRHGVRLEQNYLVTDRGVCLKTEFPLEF